MLHFAGMTLDLARGRLSAQNRDDKSFALLTYFLKHPNVLISKEVLISAIWPGIAVTEASLTQCISEVREAIGDRDKTVLETVPRRGYLFNASISEDVFGPSAVTPQTSALRPPDERTLPDRPSIAVLPFSNASDDPGQEFLGDGIAEEVLTALSKDRCLFVIARNSTFTYRNRTIDVRQVSRELGIRYVLEGSVRRVGERTRILCRLIDATMGNCLWSGRFDRDLNDIFAVQDEITRAVTDAIRPAIADAERQRAMRKSPDSLDAWEAYQRGMYYLSTNIGSDNVKAQQFFQRAVDLEPNFAAAYEGLGGAITAKGVVWHTMTVEEASALGEHLSRKALLLDDQSAHARARIALAMYMRGELEGAIRICQEALQIDPNCDRAYANMGACLLYSGRRAEARAALLTSLELSPKDPAFTARSTWLANSYYLDGAYETACEIFERAHLRYPGYIQLYRWYAACLGQLGKSTAAATLLASAPPRFDEFAKKRPPYVREVDHEHLLEGMRKAGWKG